MEGKVVFEGQTKAGLSVVVRYPKRSDLQALWQHINVLSEERTFLLVQGVSISLESERDWLETKLNEIKRHETVMLSAYVGDNLAGNTEIRMAGGVKQHVGTFGIALAQAYRGKGVGELLMQAVIQEATARVPRLEIVELEVFGNNSVAMNLYQKLGFVEHGRLPRGILHRDQYVDGVYMYRTIAR